MTVPSPHPGTHPDDYESLADAAIAHRLARLATMPVDTTTLDRALRAQLPPAPPQSAARRNSRRFLAPLLALAASLLLLAAVALPFMQGREVQASPVLMAQMYHDVVDGRVPTMRANSLDQANSAIAAFAGNFPTLPQPPAGHMMACCMRNIQNKKVACLLLDNAGTPVTMVVASAADVRSPATSTIVQNGITYHVSTTNDLHMISVERNSYWICLISPLPQSRLIQLAQGIHF